MAIVRVENRETGDILSDYVCEDYNLETGAMDNANFDVSIYKLTLIEPVEEETEEIEEPIDNEGEDIIE